MSHLAKNKGILLESGTNEVEFLIVNLGPQRYGINVSKICQITVYDPAVISLIPASHPEIIGVMAFRDETITIIDLSIHLKRKDELPQKRLLVVTEFNGRRTGFIVDTVSRIERTGWDEFEPIAASAGDVATASVLGTLRKPEGIILIIDLETILAALDPSMNIETYATEIKSSSVRRDQVRILHCEDSALVQKLVYKVLSEGGFSDIVQAKNGEQGLELLNSTPSKFDIIISDIEMPKMDGLTLCRRLRNDKRFTEMPVLFFSSLINEQMLSKCRAVGGNAAFSKPQIGQLASAVDDFLSRRAALQTAEETN